MLAVSGRKDSSSDVDHCEAHLNYPVCVILYGLGHAANHHISVTDSFHLKGSIIVGLIIELDVQSAGKRVSTCEMLIHIHPLVLTDSTIE